MALYFSLIFLSFLFHFFAMIPFINFLYALRLQRREQKTKDPFGKATKIFDKFNAHKKGTPIGGGIIVVFLTTFLYLASIFAMVFLDKTLVSNYSPTISEIKIILFSFIFFFFLGLYDDLNKIFVWKKDAFFGLRLRHKLIIEIILSLIIGYWLYSELHISIINVPFVGVFHLGWFYILFAAFVILAFSNAVNITDGIDGLSTGILMIALASFWVIARSILDVPTSLFIAVWLGGLLAFLYFNIYPARIFLGDAGALAFGATFAVIGLILGKVFALIIIGGVFVLEVTTSFLQLFFKRFFKRKLFPVAPLHLYLQLRGWHEAKVVMRMWILSMILSILGLAIAFIK